MNLVASRSLAALALAAATAAAAQEAAPAMPEDPRAPRFQEIERGFFAAAEVGWLGLFKTPVAEVERYPAARGGGGFASGPAVGLQLGADIGDRVAAALVLFGATPTASVGYGAFSLMGAGGDVRVSLLGLRDSQRVERLQLYLHARGAWFATDPRGLFGKTDVLLGGGPGLEYATRLRHFSLGLAVDGVLALKAKAPGIAVLPTLRYTF